MYSLAHNPYGCHLSNFSKNILVPLFYVCRYYSCLSRLNDTHVLDTSCSNLYDPIDYNLPGSSVPGILQARILEWVVISSSRGSSQLRDGTWLFYVSCIGRRALYDFRATWEANI